jgi:hypothetical protein
MKKTTLTTDDVKKVILKYAIGKQEFLARESEEWMMNEGLNHRSMNYHMRKLVKSGWLYRRSVARNNAKAYAYAINEPTKSVLDTDQVKDNAEILNTEKIKASTPKTPWWEETADMPDEVNTYVHLAKQLAAALPDEVYQLHIDENRIVKLTVRKWTEEIVELND